MNSVPDPRALCPVCENPIDTTRMAYGYCALCRDFHAAKADLDPTIWTPPPMMGGGFMRCCADSLRAWSIYHPAPWEPDTIVRCVFSEDAFLHAMKYCSCGHWHWVKTRCALPVKATA